MQSLLFFFMALWLSPPVIAVEYASVAARETAAYSLAVETLAKELDVVKAEISMVHLAKFNWPNSALGCPKPGVVYTQVIVPGYLALLKHKTRHYRVHLGKGRGIICQLALMPATLTLVILDKLTTMAKTDLAYQLRVDVDKIRVVDSQPMIWPDSNFNCTTADTVNVLGNIRGYKLKLDYNGRIFEYRTSRSIVKACPAIAVE